MTETTAVRIAEALERIASLMEHGADEREPHRVEPPRVLTLRPWRRAAGDAG